MVATHPWFRFGFRAGARRISFDYAADATGRRPGGNLLVSRIMTIPEPGRTSHTTGPSGDAPPMTISKLLRQIDGPAPDLTTLWVSRHKQAPAPLPFGDLVAAALVQLCRAKAPPLERDDGVRRAQRALGSDRELETIVDLGAGSPVVLASDGAGTLTLRNPGRLPQTFLSFSDAMSALREQRGARLARATVRFERANHDNRWLGDGPWVDGPPLRKLVRAAIDEIARESAAT